MRDRTSHRGTRLPFTATRLVRDGEVPFIRYAVPVAAPTKTEKLLAAYESFAAAIAGVPDERAQSLPPDFCRRSSIRRANAGTASGGYSLEQGRGDSATYPGSFHRMACRSIASVPEALAREFPAFIALKEERLNKVLARGRTRTEAEYYRVRHEFDVLEGDPGKQSTIDAYEARA
jgi:hypothetical protein